MPNLAMRQPGTLFSAEGLDLSWPIGGDREVVEWPDDKMSLRIRRRIAEGSISIVNDKPTKTVESDAREYKLMTGEEARKHFEEPAGPVTRVVYEAFEPEVKLVEAGVFTPLSKRAEKHAELAAEAAEEDSQTIAKRQIEKEKAAEKEAKEAAKEAEKAEPDPIAERLKRTEDVLAENAKDADKAFMEKEKERQKIEKEWTLSEKGAAALSEAETGPEPDTKEAEKKAAAAEKERQAKEAETEKERQAAAKAAAEAEKKSADTQKALSEPTPASAPKPGETPKSKGGQPKS